MFLLRNPEFVAAFPAMEPPGLAPTAAAQQAYLDRKAAQAERVKQEQEEEERLKKKPPAA